MIIFSFQKLIFIGLLRFVFRPNELLVRTEGNKLVVCAEVKDRKDYEKQTNKKITARFKVFLLHL